MYVEMIYVCKITIQSTCIPYLQFHTYYNIIV